MPTFQTPDRQPLVAPPLPVAGNSQIAQVVRGMIGGQVDPSDIPAEKEERPPERILKPYGIDMLPHSEKDEVEPGSPEDSKADDAPDHLKQDDQTAQTPDQTSPAEAERPVAESAPKQSAPPEASPTPERPPPKDRAPQPEE